MPLPPRLPQQPLMHVFYLHGFASSARSSKARFFTERLAPLGIPLHRPDFNEPDFGTITTTRMIGQVERAMAALEPGPMALIGSSLGAFVAWHAAARQHAGGGPADRPITHLVLLAPALDFGANRMRELGEEGIERWRTTGWLEWFHYGFNEPRRVHYELYEDARRYDSLRAEVSVPTLIFQGTRDALVDPAMVTAFAESRPTVRLELLDDEHQLLGSLERVWQGTAEFLGLPAKRS